MSYVCRRAEKVRLWDKIVGQNPEGFIKDPNFLGKFLTVPLNPDSPGIQSILLPHRQHRMGLDK